MSEAKAPALMEPRLSVSVRKADGERGTIKFHASAYYREGEDGPLNAATSYDFPLPAELDKALQEWLDKARPGLEVNARTVAATSRTIAVSRGEEPGLRVEGLGDA